MVAAPFAGVVSRRYADKGAMIQAGTASQTQAMPIIRLSQVDVLRLAAGYGSADHLAQAVNARSRPEIQ